MQCRAAVGVAEVGADAGEEFVDPLGVALVSQSTEAALPPASPLRLGGDDFFPSPKSKLQCRWAQRLQGRPQVHVCMDGNARVRIGLDDGALRRRIHEFAETGGGNGKEEPEGKLRQALHKGSPCGAGSERGDRKLFRRHRRRARHVASQASHFRSRVGDKVILFLFFFYRKG